MANVEVARVGRREGEEKEEGEEEEEDEEGEGGIEPANLKGTLFVCDVPGGLRRKPYNHLSHLSTR